jgi:hypothetical protein
MVTNEGGGRLVDLLIGSITNVRRELKFFEDVAGRYGLDIEAREVGEGVRRYRELFFGVGEGVESGQKGMLEGLVVLWGTEKVCLPVSPFRSSVLDSIRVERGEEADHFSAILRLGGMLRAFWEREREREKMPMEGR